MGECEILSECLACGSRDLLLVLDLGEHPLANQYVSSGIIEKRYPLAVNLCQQCFHLQLTHIVDPAIIYQHYLYATGTSMTSREYSRWFATFSLEYFSRAPQSILDIGCNDGTQLLWYKKLGLDTFGIDPAKNLYPFSSVDHTVWCDFFDSASPKKINRKFDIILAQNSFAHNPKPLQALLAMKELMHDESLLFVQTSQADMVKNQEFDSIYHEHINFFNINSMNRLCTRAGLNLIDVQKTSIHGTSYVFVVSKHKAAPRRIENLIKQEGQRSAILYQEWASDIKHNMRILGDTIQQYREQGYILVGYGAAAKGNTVLNFADITLDYIVDDSPLKQGYATPGKHCPIVSPEVLRTLSQSAKVAVVLLAWNFYDEIQQHLRKLRAGSNDVVIQYFPKVTVQ